MGVTETGRSGNALLLGPSGTIPGYMLLGSGSGAFNVNRTGLIAETNRKAFDNTDIATAKQIGWEAAFSSVTMSGTFLREIGVSSEASGGTVWDVEAFPAIEFDGTIELEGEIVFVTY